MKHNSIFINKLDSCITYWFLLFGGFLFVVFKGGDCLQITDLKVPNVVENGSESAVVLDCDYSLDSSDISGLVVKWFIDNNPTPVYQWIPPKPPQDLGKLKGKLNLKYKASDEEYKKHRALQIMNPSPELSGEYKCSVANFQHETFQSKKMVVFVPQSNLRFWHSIDPDDREDNNVEQDSSKGIENIVNVTCLAENVFPEPIIRIFSASKPVTDKGHVKTRKKVDGLYDVSASIQVDDDDMNTEEHVFECELSIPEANYTVKKALLVSLGYPTEEPYIETTSTTEISTTPGIESSTYWYSSTTDEYFSSTEFYDDNDNSTENSMGASWFVPMWLLIFTSIFTVTVSFQL